MLGIDADGCVGRLARIDRIARIGTTLLDITELPKVAVSLTFRSWPVISIAASPSPTAAHRKLPASSWSKSNETAVSTATLRTSLNETDLSWLDVSVCVDGFEEDHLRPGGRRVSSDVVNGFVSQRDRAHDATAVVGRGPQCRIVSGGIDVHVKAVASQRRDFQ